MEKRIEDFIEFDIARQRLINQHIANPVYEKPDDLVQWLGAVQAQDYAAAKWALGLRLRCAVDDDIEQAFTKGALLRTHLMRPTWHFVAPVDIRWMLALTAPRVHALNAPYYRKTELDQGVFSLSSDVLVKVLQGGQQRTRDEIRVAFQHAGIPVDGGLRMGLLLMRAELDGLICSGPRRGKQFTYMLLEERAPHARVLERDESLAELARRFFTSHGPATVGDLAKWSGLTASDGRSGLQMVKSQLAHETANGSTYWFSAAASPANDISATASLLPNYDEYTIGYRDHTAVFDSMYKPAVVLGNTLVINGRIVGAWRRTLRKNTVTIELDSFNALTNAENEAVTAAASQYSAFLGLESVDLIIKRSDHGRS